MYTKQPKKMLTMNILDILKRYTDEDHRLSQKEIMDILEREYDMKVERKAVSMVMKFIKLPFKLLALPIILILMAAALLIKLVTNLSAYVMGPLMLFILGCGIYSAVQQMWTSVAILVVLEILCVAAMFFAVVIETALDGMKDSLVGFVHS